MKKFFNNETSADEIRYLFSSVEEASPFKLLKLLKKTKNHRDLINYQLPHHGGSIIDRTLLNLRNEKNSLVKNEIFKCLKILIIFDAKWEEKQGYFISFREKQELTLIYYLKKLLNFLPYSDSLNYSPLDKFINPLQSLSVYYKSSIDLLLELFNRNICKIESTGKNITSIEKLHSALKIQSDITRLLNLIEFYCEADKMGCLEKIMRQIDSIQVDTKLIYRNGPY